MCELAHDNCAGFAQFSHGGCITDTSRVLANPRRRALDVQLIFNRDRDAMHRPAPFPLRNFRFSCARVHHGALSHQIDVCVQFSIDGLDPIEHRARQLDRRELAVFNQLLCFVNRQVIKRLFCECHGNTPLRFNHDANNRRISRSVRDDTMRSILDRVISTEGRNLS